MTRVNKGLKALEIASRAGDPTSACKTCLECTSTWMILIGFLKGGVKRCNASLFKFASEAGDCELRGKKRLKRILGFRASGWLAEADTYPGGKLPRIPSKFPGRLES